MRQQGSSTCAQASLVAYKTQLIVKEAESYLSNLLKVTELINDHD